MMLVLLPVALAMSELDIEGETGPVFLSETLPSGLSVSILADPALSVVATQMWVNVGSAHEASNEKGFAHLFEHLMFGETTNHGKEDYSRYHTIHGGDENAYTAFDNTVYISEIGPQWHDQVLVYEADRMANLVLSADNLANEQKIVTEELRLRTENDPFSRLLNPALHAIFGEHPYGHSPAGTKEDIAAADLELVRKFYAGYYHPANLHLVIVGPVDAYATLDRVRELFAPREGQALVPPEVPELSTWSFPERVDLREDIPPIKVAALVYLGPTERSEDWWPWKLMTEMLCGGELDRFREELVTDGGEAVEAMTIPAELRSGSILAFGSISLPFRRLDRALKLLHQGIDTLSEGAWMTSENLETARRRVLRQELERRYYAASAAEAIGQAGSWQGNARLGYEGVPALLDAVTLDQVKEVWRRYVATGAPVELTIRKGPAGGAQ